MNREKRAIEVVKERLDKIYDVYETPDFVEVSGRVGGDTVCYRVYFNGNNVDYIAER